MILAMETRAPVSEVVEAEGHLIDSQLLNLIFDTVIKGNASFEVLRVHDRPDQRRAVVDLDADHRARRTRPAAGARRAGDARLPDCQQPRCAASSRRTSDGCAPRRLLFDDEPPDVRAARRAVAAGRAAADGRGRGRSTAAGRCAASCATSAPATRSSAASRASAWRPSSSERDRHGFAFMTNEISSERRVEAGVARIADDDARGEDGAAAASPSSPGRSWSTPAASRYF